jgi:hypothetical protein
LEALSVEIRMVVAANGSAKDRRPAATIDRRSGLNIDPMAVFQSCAGETMREGATLSKTVS